jgi:hypothetical protein
MATENAATAGFPLSRTDALTWIGRNGREQAGVIAQAYSKGMGAM